MGSVRLSLAPLLLAALGLSLLIAAPAPGRQAPIHPPVEVAIGGVDVGTTAGGQASLLVPVRYPIQMAGRRADLRVGVLAGEGGALLTVRKRERLSSGPERSPERRRGFTFVHRVDLGPALSRRLEEGLRVRLRARNLLDVEGDGRAELASTDRSGQALPPADGDGALCSSVPRLRTPGGRRLRAGYRLTAPLPVCATGAEWKILRQPRHGRARIRDGRLIYHPPARFRGSEEIVLVGKRPRGAGSSASKPLVPSHVQLTVGTAGDAVVRALGDSVTAGFGYYSNGTPLTIGRLPGCRPAAKEFNDACSSNSLNFTSEAGKVEYAPDYGLANDVSWAAQWANEHGVTDFKNFAVSGSEPANWAPGGELHKTAELLASEDPDYILMTIGANPLLSEMLFGVDNMGCAVESDIVGGYRECVEEAFAEVRLQANLESLYNYLVQNTGATIYLMRYHLSVPSSALAYSAAQIAMMGALLNREIEKVAAAVNPKRLRVVIPPHFNVGIDISPVFPSTFSCSSFGYEVDGPSVQSSPTQDELEVLHPLSFCDGPASGPPWVISGDTGIHPSAAGYAQMASQVPPPS